MKTLKPVTNLGVNILIQNQTIFSLSLITSSLVTHPALGYFSPGGKSATYLNGTDTLAPFMIVRRSLKLSDVRLFFPPKGGLGFSFEHVQNNSGRLLPNWRSGLDSGFYRCMDLL